MTDSQRRYLFRLLAKRRVMGNDAKETLQKAFAVQHLREVSREAASSLIDRLIREDEDTLQRNLQLTAYHYAYQEMTGKAPTLEVVTLLKQKSPRCYRLPTVRTNEDHSWFVHLVEQVNRGIENNVFPPNPGWPCTECEYARECRGWRG